MGGKAQAVAADTTLSDLARQPKEAASRSQKVRCSRRRRSRPTRRPPNLARQLKEAASRSQKVLHSLSALFRQQLPTWSLALNISYSLGTNPQEASVARARIQQSQIEVQLRQLDLQVASDISNAAIQVQNTAERVQAAQAARELAQQQLDAENTKFGVGMSTNYLVVLTQRDLANMQNNELQAVLAYRRAVVEFERLQQTGSGANITVISR